MTDASYFNASVAEFLLANDDEILGALTRRHGFSLEHQQKHAWQAQICILKEVLPADLEGQIFFEFAIPRMGKRADVVLIVGGVIFVIEFKIGAHHFERSGIEQVHDYALDLKNFHLGSHQQPIVPVLVCTNVKSHELPSLEWADDSVAVPIGVSTANLLPLVHQGVLEQAEVIPINPWAWAVSGYQPTPTIIEAALALYRNHDVQEIARSDASAQNLGRTSDCIAAIIEDAKLTRRKAICFVTGVPGAGKTLAGLNIATARADEHADEHAVFLSGNGPLVDVLREALARDQAAREGISKKDAHRKVASFVQNIHHFRDDALRGSAPPVEHVVVFDEAQRAWSREQASKFMQQKRGHLNFDMSEPAFLISVMDRHEDWCVIVCLVGGGQEINTGEAGLSEWLIVLKEQFPNWLVHVSPRVESPDYLWGEAAGQVLNESRVRRDEALHLAVSLRSFRAEALSEMIGHVVENRCEQARAAHAAIAERYPIVLVRDLDLARDWVRCKARGSERYGLLASSGGYRLRPESVWVKAKIDAPAWFLNERVDVRSSFYLEEVATEFDVQGLELDWALVCWDADFRYVKNEWRHFGFRGTAWMRMSAAERQMYLKNAYRVVLTRARQGMAIFIPRGDAADRTRLPEFYDQTFEYLRSCGLQEYLG
ncbi:DUF2075 domain-containing protein [Ferribacterium limneticum]|uniref:DUF2075 domain-containing protein n=1 Tax=Ferribacterium limneticum TaxID=76259 RepID=UPI001CFC12EB|nr:DUF2075 domain-containing protein [Ferribacterium limneticum]UCV28240.1 DUF2075 domain-containing protein [Ferribacterium limneticum]UCV32157.1 DUF2075 domain-containing protein [Ferribacterium limneticum]